MAPVPGEGPVLTQNVSLQLAPPWFYSALKWLAYSYHDANMARQSFSPYMIGSDVDPYFTLGLTRLFVIFRRSDHYYLTIASNVNSLATFSIVDANIYPDNDDGIVRMYQDLEKSSIFPLVNYCYIPGSVIGATPKAAPEIVSSPEANRTAMALPLPFENGGYDPDTGMRIVATGSAIAQVVPVDDYLSTHNEQIYNVDPNIVPIANSLVYNISALNRDSNTFFLPTIYTVDSVATVKGDYYVNRRAIDRTGKGEWVGQTTVFPGGPGYTSGSATSLALQNTTSTTSQGHVFTNYAFQQATVVAIDTTFQPSIDTGVYAFTYSSTVSPSILFSNQRIIGWYRSSDWLNGGGVPIYDFGPQNTSFTAIQTSPFESPFTIYDPLHSTLNGGSLHNAIDKLLRATYMFSQETLVSLLRTAAKAPKDQDGGASLSVTTVGLDFTLPQHSTSTAPAQGGSMVPGPVSEIPRITPSAADSSLIAKANALQLQIANASVFVYSNINVDTYSVGSVSSNNVFLASAVINSSTKPRDAISDKLVLGLVRQVRMANSLNYVFIPVDDSVLIGNTRYMLSVINILDVTADPNSYPYPPVFWPQSRYWQFANRHNPYLSVAYTGDDQSSRIAQAQRDIHRISQEIATTQAPMQMFLDTDAVKMTMWPIYALPFSASAQVIDKNQLAEIKSTILKTLNTPFPTTSLDSGPVDAEQITVPNALQLNNPYTADTAISHDSYMKVNETITTKPIEPVVVGLPVTNLSPNAIAPTTAKTLREQQSLLHQKNEVARAKLAATKALTYAPQTTQTTSSETTNESLHRIFQEIYGFSIYNQTTGEAYIIEVSPDFGENPTHDVRVVFLNTLTCYNMSIIVPSMVYDQYNILARQIIPYQNLFSKTDELDLGYMYSLYDTNNNFDIVSFSPYSPTAPNPSTSPEYVFTNIPYSISGPQGASNPPTSSPPAFFLCRRENWRTDSHLMQAINPAGTSIYLSFGAGDIVPLRLDQPVIVDKRPPALMYPLTHTISDQLFNSVKTVTVNNTPYIVTTVANGLLSGFFNVSFNPTAGTADLQLSSNSPLTFPMECCIIGQASTTLTSMNVNTGTFMVSDAGGFTPPQFELVTYNNLVYLVRAVSDITALAAVGGLNIVSGLLVDTFVPGANGNLQLAQGARYQRSKLSFFGSSYTPITMVDTLDTLDYKSLTGDTFYAPTIFIPMPELDCTKGFVADISNFLGQTLWTFIYPEIVAQPGETINGKHYPNGFNIDGDSKPILSLQKLHFVYDPLAVMFTPDDLTHKYPLKSKQQVLALTNDQIREGICWRSANVEPQFRAPTNICAQQILPDGIDMDRANIIYSSHNCKVITSSDPSGPGYQGMSVNSFISISGSVYNIEERALAPPELDQTGLGFISAVSSVSNMLLGILFDYDNNDLGTLTPYNSAGSSKGLVFLNGYLSGSGYNFSSPDHFDVNDMLPFQVPRLEQMASVLGYDSAFYNTDIERPRQYWSLTYDTFTPLGIPNYLTDVPRSVADPNFTNRTRSLILSFQNPVRPTELGIMDTYNSVVSANLHLENGITGSILLSKVADREVASIGTGPVLKTAASRQLYGLVGDYDFYLFSRNHYGTLEGVYFELVDEGYAMCIVDDGSGTGTMVASYYIDSTGNYYELYTYALLSSNVGIIETSTFTVKVSLGTPNNVNPQDLVDQINGVSKLVYAAFGPSSPGQPSPSIPIQAVAQAAPIAGAPGYNGYNINVISAGTQPVTISQIYSRSVAYKIVGTTMIHPVDVKTNKPIPFCGSISHGLDSMSPASQGSGQSHMLGGNGLGALINTPLSWSFSGSGATVPPSNPIPGTTMKADDTQYTFNAMRNTIMDSRGRSATPTGGQYFRDVTDPLNPIFAVVTTPSFVLNGNKYMIDLGSNTTPRYTLSVGGKIYVFRPNNTQVEVDETTFSFNPVSGGIYTVTYTGGQTPVPLTPFSIAAGGLVRVVDVFNNPNGLNNMVLGVTGRLYSYDPFNAIVKITHDTTMTSVSLLNGTVFVSPSGFGYVITCDNDVFKVNDNSMLPYSATIPSSSLEYPLMTSPEMFTIGGNFYTFDRDADGNYLSVTGNNQTYPINLYQFSVNGVVYIINTNVQPNVVVGGGTKYTMTAGNTQVLLDGVQYTITLKHNSFKGAIVSGQFNIDQGNVVVIESYVYQLDTINGMIIGRGNHALTTSGLTYTIKTVDNSFIVTSEPNATTVTIGKVVYTINDTTVEGDSTIYPIVQYRSFVDNNKFNILDGIASVQASLYPLSGAAPYVRSKFTDVDTYTVNDNAAFDGTNYYLISESTEPPHFTVSGITYTIRTDGVAITAGTTKTYLVGSGPLSPNQFKFGNTTIFFGRPTDTAAFDGTNYFTITDNHFTDSTSGLTYTLSGNFAVNAGNSYEVFSELGQDPYFQVPGGPIYFVNISVANTGSASGDIYNVFPISEGEFTVPLVYTINIASGVVTVVASTFTGVVPLMLSGDVLIGGSFVDPVTKITYTCTVDGSSIVFVDSNDAVYKYPAPNTSNQFVARAVISTGLSMAVNQTQIYPILNDQFTTPSATYAINKPIAYINASGPYFPIVNGQFIILKSPPMSSLAYTIKDGGISKGYVISNDDQFSIDGNVVYTINDVNVVKATNQAELSGEEPNQTLVAGSSSYTLNTTLSLASTCPDSLIYNSDTGQFTVSYNGINVTYSVLSKTVLDDRHPMNRFPSSVVAGVQTFKDTITNVTFTFDSCENSSIKVDFVYTNNFFVDAMDGVTYFIDVPDMRVEAISYIPETTQYGFSPDGNTYLIHYNDVSVVFPVISGPNVNVGVSTIGSDTFSVHVDEVDSTDGGAGIRINYNSFEINGNMYTIVGNPEGSNYSGCQVVGHKMKPATISSSNTFSLTDPTIRYRLQLDSMNLPKTILATFVVKPSRDLITINDDVYIITYNSISTGSLLGQGQASIPINNSRFTLTNSLDSTESKFIFADLNIYDSASVIGQFPVYLAPTFDIGTETYALNSVNRVVTNSSKQPFPLLPNPTMFSINGSNYVIDANRTPHAIVGNNNVSPLSTDVTVQRGYPIPNSTFTLNAITYQFVQDAFHNLVVIKGLKSYMVNQGMFKLESSLVFTINYVPPPVDGHPGSIGPIGTITAGALTLNIYAGVSESGNADFFTYKSDMYILMKSKEVYVAVQKSYGVYVANPSTTQQQLAIFNLNGVTCIVTDGTTPGDSPGGINPGTIWAATSTSKTETQFGLVYGFPQPIAVSRSTLGMFQFTVTDGNNTTLYDISFSAKGNNNVIKVDFPDHLSTFTQSFSFGQSFPLTFETGGYNAFAPTVEETASPIESFSASYRTPVVSKNPAIDNLITTQGDFSLEFWHSIPVVPLTANHPFTYAVSSKAFQSSEHPVHYIDIDFEDQRNIFLAINDTLMQCVTSPAVLSSGWRHVALVYTQPYVMECSGDGFEVKQASNYNFNSDFSIIITFSVSDTTNQGLLYKGTGSSSAPPELSLSYRVAILDQNVTIAFTDGSGTPRLYIGPPIKAFVSYRLIITKCGNANASSGDPYSAPFDISDFGASATSGATLKSSNPSGTINITNIAPNPPSSSTKLSDLIKSLQNPTPNSQSSYFVTFSLQVTNTDGTFQTAVQIPRDSQNAVPPVVNSAVQSTGNAHLLIGTAYDDNGQAMPLGSNNNPGNIQNVYVFKKAIDPGGINTSSGTVDVSQASTTDLIQAGLVGYWKAAYNPNGVVVNLVDSSAGAASLSATSAKLVPLKGYELEATNLYLNGYSMTLTLVNKIDNTKNPPAPNSSVPSSMLTGYVPTSRPLLIFNAGLYKLSEISMWNLPRLQYQILDDMFGRLIPSNEPSPAIYLPGSYTPNFPRPLPMSKSVDNIKVPNLGSLKDSSSNVLQFSPASLSLFGSPAMAICGPLVTPNLYTPPGVALTVCDTVPKMTTYSITVNNITSTLAGEINEVYAYIVDHVLTLYAGKKVGDLVLSWVSQEQGDVQLIGYVEGAPPCPMANLTNQSTYNGATSVTLTVPSSVSLTYMDDKNNSNQLLFNLSDKFGGEWEVGMIEAPIGFGIKADPAVVKCKIGLGDTSSIVTNSGGDDQSSSNLQVNESNQYTVQLRGTPSLRSGDTFMSILNTNVGTSNTANLPNPSLGGFKKSNPPAQLPSMLPTDERFGSPMFQPSPYGQAFVTSQTLDVYQQTLLQTNTVYGYVRVPNSQIPRDNNTVSFRMSSKYIRPGCLDGVVGYVYQPATLPDGKQTYDTSTGQMQVLYDKNFNSGDVGHNASYMQVVEAYQLKKQIDQEASNTLALYQAAYNDQNDPNTPTLTQGLDFYNEYIWSSRGGTQEVKHTYSTSYNEVHSTSSGGSTSIGAVFNLKLTVETLTAVDFKFDFTDTNTNNITYSFKPTNTTSFDVTTSLNGIDSDTQMRYASANDAHFVMNYNSEFNPNNQTNLNLVIGSDGRVYNIVPSVASGAGLPLSDNIDDSQVYTQPQPTYVSSNSNGLTGNLEPYDRPGKTSRFRMYTFFLQPKTENSDTFWSTIIDPVWLANSPDPDANAMRSAQSNTSLPWRLLYRVTDSERFLPPVSTDTTITPQITPLMAIPVINPAADFLFTRIGQTPRPSKNPANDIDANIVLVAPTASGLSAGPAELSNNVIPFNILTNASSIGEPANLKLVTRLINSILGLNTVSMSVHVPPGSKKVLDILDSATGNQIYTIYTDPNGLTVNFATNAGITVYQDVNSNPIQYFDGNTYHSLQADYIASSDGTVMFYIQPPSDYDQSKVDLGSHPWDEWRYYLVSGLSADMTSETSIVNSGPFRTSTSNGAAYTGLTVATSLQTGGSSKVVGYVIVKGLLVWPNLNSNFETIADVSVYKTLNLLDIFPIGDIDTLISFLKAQYPSAPFIGNPEINSVFANNIISYFNSAQQGLLTQ